MADYGAPHYWERRWGDGASPPPKGKIVTGETVGEEGVGKDRPGELKEKGKDFP